MLKRVGDTGIQKELVDPEGAIVKIKEASFPAPFCQGLEFNSPVHGNWNIVHTGMLMPEAIQIYVCADNCMRGVVLTAAEMNAADRFSYVIIEEDDLLNGNLEDITIEGVTDVLNKLDQKPKAVLLFPGVRLEDGLRGVGKTIPGDRICPLLYGSDHAKTWSDTGSETSESYV